MKEIIHKFKTVEQDYGILAIHVACSHAPGLKDEKNTSVDWEDITCKKCLKKRKVK